MKDHWLSQFYLRNFAIPGWKRRQDAEIWQTNLRQCVCSREKIQDVAQEAHFYSFENADGVFCRRVDEKLTLLESNASRAYAQLVTGATDLNNAPSMKMLVALFLATTLLRTPSQQKKSSEDHRLLRELLDGVPKSSSGRPQLDYIRAGHLFVPLDASDFHEWNKDDEGTVKWLFAEKIEVRWPLGGTALSQAMDCALRR